MQGRNKRRRNRQIKRLVRTITNCIIMMFILCLIVFMSNTAKQIKNIETDINDLSEKITITNQSIQEDKKVAEIEQKGTQNANQIDNHTRDYIERVVAAESRGETYKEMCAVAQTIKDRSDLWEKTPLEIVSAEKQYASPYDGEVSIEVKNAVSDVFDDNYRVFAEPTTHFHNDTVSPKLAELKACRGVIDRTSFYY